MTVTAEVHHKHVNRTGEELPDRHIPTNPATLYILQQRARLAVAQFARLGLTPLTGKRILEVGCGRGGWLPFFEDCGVAREDLAGIDLDLARVEGAARRLCAHRDEHGRVLAGGADIRCGDATALPWGDGTFDLVVQSTLFTSILDNDVKRTLAAEMVRVLRPGGVIVWYDLIYNNPANPSVRGIGRREIRSYFPTCRPRLHRVTLAPPIARRLVPFSWLTAVLLESLCVLNTHYFGLLRKPD